MADNVDSPAIDSSINKIGALRRESSVGGIKKRTSLSDATLGYEPNQINTNPQTLTRWILQEQQMYPEAKGDLSILLNSICTACKIISNAASKAGIYDLYGLAGTGNVSGDQVKKLDIYGNDCMINCLSSCGVVSYMASEENDVPILVQNSNNKYVCVFDPVDGSSNIDANVSTGTIFGIYNTTDADKPNADDLLQKGTELVCSGYCMYGGATILVLTLGKTVNGFTLDPSLGEFILTHPNIQIKKRGKIYSVNEGNASKWDPCVSEYVNKCKTSGPPRKARYIGSMVADVHRTLLYGGIFMYPGDSKNKSGKLRLVYELNPMAFLIETAGGLATTGRERIRDLKPTRIHERKPVFLGSPVDVKELIQVYADYDAKQAEEKK